PSPQHTSSAAPQSARPASHEAAQTTPSRQTCPAAQHCSRLSPQRVFSQIGAHWKSSTHSSPSPQQSAPQSAAQSPASPGGVLASVPGPPSGASSQRPSTQSCPVAHSLALAHASSGGP